MAFLHIIPLGLIILNIRSICCAFGNFSCETYGTNAEYGKNTNITCRNNKAITSVAVKFCPYNNCSCPAVPEINTFAGIYTSKDRRISLKLDNFAILIFNNVQISDERCYAFYLYSSNGRKPRNIRFTVVAPYTKPQLMRKKETVECTATGGYPDKHLYWFDSNEANLTHNATFMSTQYVDGSFFLNSSLHLDSLANERTYCCTLNNTSCHSSQKSMVKHELMVIIAVEGDSVNMTCHFNHLELIDVYLKRTLGKPMDVIYATAYGKDKNEAPEYKNRTEYFQLNNTVMITLQQVKKSDSDAYVCEGTLLRNKQPHIVNSSSFILAVKEKTEDSSSPWMLHTLVFLSLLVVSILGCFFLSHINVKKYCRKGKGQELQNIVYEDMTCNLRSNTMARSNLYSVT